MKPFLSLAKYFLFLGKCFLYLGKYFLFLGNYFYFSVSIFYFLGNVFISGGIFVIFRDMSLFNAKYLSVSRGIVLISRGALGFGRPFRKYAD